MHRNRIVITDGKLISQVRVNKRPTKITRESSRRSRKRDGEKSERTKEEKSPSVTPTRRSSRRRSKKSHRESKHQGRAVRHASLDEIQHSDSFSSLTSLWIPVTSSGLELPMDWYWDKKHPMSSAKKTMKQVDIEIRKEDNVSPKVTHYKYARELTENGRPVRHNPRVRPRTAVVKGKKKKSKGQKQNVETTIQVDSPGEIMDGSDDRSDFLDAEQLILEQDLTEAANTSELKTTQRGQAKKRERKKNKENQKDISTAKGEKSGKSKSKEKEKEKDNKNMPPSLANLQLNQLSPRVQGRLDMRKAGLELTANGIKRGEGGLKHWPEFQVNDSDNCKTDLNENSVKPALHFADLAAKPHAANFAFAIHRLEKTSIQFEKDLHHTKHDLEHKLHKLKKKFYDYMDVTDDRLDEAERCQDLYYHEIKEDLAGIKRSLEQTSRTDTATLMEQVKKEIDESMMKWYCKIQDKTRCDSPGSHVSNTSSKSSSSDKKVSKKHKEGSGKNETDAADGACCDTLGSDDGKSGDSSSGRKKANHLRFPPQGNSDDTQSPVRPAHPGDGDSMTLQRLYEVKLKDVEQYWKAKSEEENDLLTRRIKELEELLYKETGFHNTLV